GPREIDLGASSFPHRRGFTLHLRILHNSWLQQRCREDRPLRSGLSEPRRSGTCLDFGFSPQGESMAQPRILIVEDERGLTQSLSWYCNREGYETIVAHDGQEGLRKAQTLLPDVLLLDIMLPSLSGLEVCRELRSGERTKDLPIIMLTARAEET